MVPRFTSSQDDNSKSISSPFSGGEVVATKPSFTINQWTKLTCLEITALRLVVSAHKGTNSSINGSPGTASKEPIEKWTRAPSISIWYVCKVKQHLFHASHIPVLFFSKFYYYIWCFKNTTPKITFIAKVVTHEFPYYPFKKNTCHWPVISVISCLSIADNPSFGLKGDK